MLQKNFIVLFSFISSLAMDITEPYGEVFSFEGWFMMAAKGEIMSFIAISVYLYIFACVLFVFRNKFVTPSHAYLFVGGLLVLLGLNFYLQYTIDKNFMISAIISGLPLIGCIIYLGLKPGKITNSNDRKLV